MRALLTCWGTRGTCPSPGAHTVRYGGNTSCMDVQLADGSRVILDAGTGLRALGQALASAPPANRPAAPSASPLTVTIALTHLHSDHINGLAHFVPLLARTHRVRVACNETNRQVLRALVSQQLSAPLFPTIGGVVDAVDVHEFDAAGILHVTSTLRVRALLAHHPGAASVLLVEDHHGPLVAFAPDNELGMAERDAGLEEWRAALVQQLQGVPVLVHDATYVAHELDRFRGWGHSSAGEATELALACDARTVLLTHHHPDRSDDEVDAMVAQCAARAADHGSALRVVGAAEGLEVEIR